MTITRLKKSHRERLIEFAARNVVSPETQAALDTAYEAAAVMVSAHVTQKYPVADMAVLARYDVGAVDRCINGGNWNTFSRFDFRPDDQRAPVLPLKYCGGRRFEWEPGERTILEAWHAAKDTHDNAIAGKLEHYKALIRSARTFEEILEVWPAADALRPVIAAKLMLPAISNNSIAFIKTDNCGAPAAA